jgi:hypothetical protein
MPASLGMPPVPPSLPRLPKPTTSHQLPSNLPPILPRRIQLHKPWCPMQRALHMLLRVWDPPPAPSPSVGPHISPYPRVGPIRDPSPRVRPSQATSPRVNPTPVPSPGVGPTRVPPSMQATPNQFRHHPPSPTAHAPSPRGSSQLGHGIPGTNLYGDFADMVKEELINYSHPRNLPCAPARTHGRIQAPREPPN